MAYCENCGRVISDQASTCPNCGHPQTVAQRALITPQGVVLRRTEGTAVASLVLGIAGFVACPIVTHILAVIFGNQARRKIQEDPTLEGEGMAKAGVILGWVGIGIFGVLAVIWIIVIIIAAATSNT